MDANHVAGRALPERHALAWFNFKPLRPSNALVEVSECLESSNSESSLPGRLLSSCLENLPLLCTSTSLRHCGWAYSISLYLRVSSGRRYMKAAYEICFRRVPMSTKWLCSTLYVQSPLISVPHIFTPVTQKDGVPYEPEETFQQRLSERIRSHPPLKIGLMKKLSSVADNLDDERVHLILGFPGVSSALTHGKLCSSRRTADRPLVNASESNSDEDTDSSSEASMSATSSDFDAATERTKKSTPKRHRPSPLHVSFAVFSPSMSYFMGMINSPLSSSSILAASKLSALTDAIRARGQGPGLEALRSIVRDMGRHKDTDLAIHYIKTHAATVLSWKISRGRMYNPSGPLVLLKDSSSVNEAAISVAIDAAMTEYETIWGSRPVSPIRADDDLSTDHSCSVTPRGPGLLVRCSVSYYLKTHFVSTAPSTPDRFTRAQAGSASRFPHHSSCRRPPIMQAPSRHVSLTHSARQSHTCATGIVIARPQTATCTDIVVSIPALQSSPPPQVNGYGSITLLPSDPFTISSAPTFTSPDVDAYSSSSHRPTAVPHISSSLRRTMPLHSCIAALCMETMCLSLHACKRW